MKISSYIGIAALLVVGLMAAAVPSSAHSIDPPAFQSVDVHDLGLMPESDAAPCSMLSIDVVNVADMCLSPTIVADVENLFTEPTLDPLMLDPGRLSGADWLDRWLIPK